MNNTYTVKAIKSCWTPDKLKCKSHAITVLSNKEYVDTTEAEQLPSKRRKKSNRRYSADEERSSSDDNDMLDYPCPPTSTPKNQQSNSMKRKLSNSLDDRISCNSISPHHQLQSKQKSKNESTDQSRQGFNSSLHGSEWSIESYLDETITADNIELASSTSVENKINHDD
ncbi:hypothetical protein FQA39_LY00279 [Lamprigera yunnana]|nr:hypothetical protein FQA39_LY00279 [Lamprigera yunnana]